MTHRLQTITPATITDNTKIFLIVRESDEVVVEVGDDKETMEEMLGLYQMGILTTSSHIEEKLKKLVEKHSK